MTVHLPGGWAASFNRRRRWRRLWKIDDVSVAPNGREITFRAWRVGPLLVINGGSWGPPVG